VTTDRDPRPASGAADDETAAEDTPRSALPPDPQQFDAPRNVRARQKGLSAPYIAGGNDPELQETLRIERRYLRLLVAMVVVLVLLGFVLGFAAALFTGATPQ
jgi:hypothetical protein